MFAVIALSSAFMFYVISLITNLLVECVVEIDLRKRWTWKNTFVSFLHAVIVSIWILYW